MTNSSRLLTLSLVLGILLTFSSAQFTVGPANPNTDYVNLASQPYVFKQFFNSSTTGNIYSGYLNISSTRALHYYFAQKANMPNAIDADFIPTINDTADLIVWLNGGPSCSSLDGAFLEHGPILINQLDQNFSDVSFRINPHSWNNFANILYIESGAGVGFSYKNDTLPQNDDTVGNDNLQGLLQFIQGFYGKSKQVYTKKVWISGESYAGTYVPYFFNAVHEYNQNITNTPLNLQGWMVGNPCTDPVGECTVIQTNTTAQAYNNIQTLVNYGILNQTYANQIYSTCNDPTQSQACQNMQAQSADIAQYDYSLVAPWLNLYDLKRSCKQDLVPFPNMNDDDSVISTQTNFLLSMFNRSSMAVLDRTLDCLEYSGLYYFFNTPGTSETTRNLFHITQNVSNFNWSFCAWTAQQNAAYNFTKSPLGSLWIYEKLIPLNKYRILVYSGVTDLAVPTLGTTTWIDKLRVNLNLDEIISTSNWYYPNANNENVNYAGNVQQLTSGLTYVRVNGVGHMVPQWAPAAAVTMITHFLNQQNLPTFNSQ